MDKESISLLFGLGTCVLTVALISGLVVSLWRRPPLPSRMQMERSRLRDRIATIPRHRVRNLKAQSYEDLAALPSCSQSKLISPNGRKIWVRQFRENLDDGSLRVVVQAFTRQYLRSHTKTAEGFIKHPDGSVSELPFEELADFLNADGYVQDSER